MSRPSVKNRRERALKRALAEQHKRVVDYQTMLDMFFEIWYAQIQQGARVDSEICNAVHRELKRERDTNT